ncbi:MAG TPA: hypothetical protein VFB16_07795 [Bauldia sp.]|nr:hypothetical protein [Bauldia sp.]
MSDASRGAAPLKGWRTLLLALGLSTVGVLQSADWATIVPPQSVGPVMLGVGVAVGVLRALTTTPIGQKEG